MISIDIGDKNSENELDEKLKEHAKEWKLRSLAAENGIGFASHPNPIEFLRKWALQHRKVTNEEYSMLTYLNIKKFFSKEEIDILLACLKCIETFNPGEGIDHSTIKKLTEKLELIY